MGDPQHDRISAPGPHGGPAPVPPVGPPPGGPGLSGTVPVVQQAEERGPKRRTTPSSYSERKAFPGAPAAGMGERGVGQGCELKAQRARDQVKQPFAANMVCKPRIEISVASGAPGERAGSWQRWAGTAASTMVALAIGYLLGGRRTGTEFEEVDKAWSEQEAGGDAAWSGLDWLEAGKVLATILTTVASVYAVGAGAKGA